MNTLPRRPTLLRFAAAALSISLTACASSEDSGPAASAATPATATQGEPLADALQRELERPDDAARNAPAPDGLDASRLAPLDGDALTKATTPLDDAIAQLEPWQPLAVPAGPPVADDARRKAVLKFTEGRARRLDGDNLGAIAALEQAARLDPAAPEPWKEIGEARLGMSDRRGARTAFERALARQPNDQETAQRLALLLDSPSDLELGASLLADLWQKPSDDLDPAMRYVLPARLGEAFHKLGFLQAGSTLIRQALELPDRFNEPTNEGFALATLYRRRGDLSVTVGDAAMRLGDVQAAHDAYEDAAQLPSLDPAGLLARRVHAFMRLGQPLHAASLLLDRVGQAGGRADETTTTLLAHVAEHSDAEDAINSALDALENALDPDQRRLAGSDLIALRTAVLGPEEAIASATAAFRQDPFHEALLAQTMRASSRISPRAAVDAASNLLAAHPTHTDRVGAHLLRLDNDPSNWLPLLDEQDAPPGQLLLEAWLTARLDQPDRALTILDEIEDPRDLHLAADVLRVRILTALGQPDRADAALDALAQQDDPAARHALVLATVNRADEDRALAILDRPETLDGQPDPVRHALQLIHARLLVDRQRSREALAILDRIVEEAPTVEEAHLLRILLRAPGSPAEDEDQLQLAVEALRNAAPNSRTIAYLRAQDTMARGRLDAAIDMLERLASEAPDDRQTLELLVGALRRADRHDDARRWVERLSELQPGVSLYTRALAELDYANRDRDSAVARLQLWLQRYPGDVAASLTLENIYKGAGEHSRARELTRKRIELGPPTLGNLGELAILQLRAGQTGDAQTTIDRMARTGSQPGSPFIARWSSRATQTLVQAIADDDVSIDDAVALLDRIGDTFDNLPVEVHQNRILILARTATPVKDLVAAVEDVVADHPESTERLFLTAIAGRRSTEIVTESESKRRAGLETRRQAIERFQVRMGDAADIGALAIERHPEIATPGVIAASLDSARRGTGTPDPRALQHYKAFGDLMLEHPARNEIVRELFGLTPAQEFQDFMGIPRPTPENLSHRAALMSSYADRYTAIGDEPRADRFGRLALEFDPEHPMANNNLGYRLLERDEDIPEAARMIRIAYESDPENVAFSDSMGWAQYKLGIVHDVLNDQGDVIDEGAVSILKRTATLNDRVPADPVYRFITRIIVLDHLGDALWVAGKREQALEQWSTAIEEVDEEARKAQDSKSILDDDQLAEVRAVVDNATEKIRAASEDRQPPIARTHAPTNQPPAATTLDLTLPTN